MASVAVLRRVAAGSPTSQLLDRAGSAAAKGLTGYLKSSAPMAAAKELAGYLKLSAPMAKFHQRNYSARTDPSVPTSKLIIELNGKLVPSVEMSSTNMYQMTILADSEEEAIGVIKNFVSVVKRNDQQELAKFCTNNKATLTEVQESVAVAATQVREHATEHFVDIRSELQMLKSTLLSGQEEVKEELKGLKAGFLSGQEDLNGLKEEIVAVKQVLGRIETDAKRFTLLKFISYAGIISIIQGLITGGIGWQCIKRYLPDPPSAETVGIPV